MKKELSDMFEEILQYESVQEWYTRVSTPRKLWYDVLSFFMGYNYYGKNKISKGLRWSGYYGGRKKIRTIEQVRKTK